MMNEKRVGMLLTVSVGAGIGLLPARLVRRIRGTGSLDSRLYMLGHVI